MKKEKKNGALKAPFLFGIFCLGFHTTGVYFNLVMGQLAMTTATAA